MKEDHFLLKNISEKCKYGRTKGSAAAWEAGTWLTFIKTENVQQHAGRHLHTCRHPRHQGRGQIIQEQGQKQCVSVSPHVCLDIPGFKGDLIETFKLTGMWLVFTTAPTWRKAQAGDDLGTPWSSPMSRATHIRRFMRTEASFRSPSASFVVNGPFVLNGNGGSPSTSDGKWIGSDSPP